jgi:hypothetical protein
VVLAHWQLHGLYPWPLGLLTPGSKSARQSDPRACRAIYLAPAKSMKDGRLQHTYPAHSAPCQTISSLLTLKSSQYEYHPKLNSVHTRHISTAHSSKQENERGLPATEAEAEDIKNPNVPQVRKERYLLQLTLSISTSIPTFHRIVSHTTRPSHTSQLGL